MKSLKHIFTVIMTYIIVLSVLLLADVIFTGTLALFTKAISYEIAQNLFRYGTITLFCAELVITIPAFIKSIKEGEKSNGS